jgi:hypothetical protein
MNSLKGICSLGITIKRRRGGLRMEIKLTADRRRSCRALFDFEPTPKA